MTLPAGGTGPSVRLQISPAPAQVRTARLVAAAVARRSGVAEDYLDEIRLAVGEACSRAVNLHRRYAPGELVTVLLAGDGAFEVTVCDQAPAGAGQDPGDSAGGTDLLSLDPDEPPPAGFGLAVIGGLVDDLAISAGPQEVGTVVRMTWPLTPAGGR